MLLLFLRWRGLRGLALDDDDVDGVGLLRSLVLVDVEANQVTLGNGNLNVNLRGARVSWLRLQNQTLCGKLRRLQSAACKGISSDCPFSS